MLQLEGEARIRCKVALSGRVEDCRVVAERPEGLGFGTAALGLSSLFKMKPKSIDGVPVAGADVMIPINFLLSSEPQTTPEGAVAPPPSARAMLFADRLVRAMGEMERMSARYRAAVRANDPSVRPPPNMRAGSAENAPLAMEAYASGFESQIPAYNEQMARVFAATFSEDELEQLSGLMESPIGQLWFAGIAKAEFSRLTMRAKRSFTRRVTTESARLYCLKVDCNPLSATASAPADPRPAP